MPKTSKKKKQQKAEDFKKVKLKVGKKKAAPTNATDTSFTARAIVLSEQSIVADKSSQLTNSRNQTLRELLTQQRHYSTTTRKEAVAGLAEFISLHGDVLRSELGPIMENSLRLVVDNEPVVRRQLLKLYSEALPGIPARDLAPFVPLAVVYICSAMTHILEDIRTDAMKFLDLLADVAPESVAQLSPRILPNLLSLLETSTSTPDSKRAEVSARTALLSQGSRLGIMRSCYRYLSVCTEGQAEVADQLQFMRPSGAGPGARGTADCPSLNCTGSGLYFHPDSPSPFGALGLFGEASNGGPDAAGPATAVCATSREALGRLFPFLQATWTEASAIFATSRIAGDPSLELCTTAMLLLRTLWRGGYPGAIPSDEKRLAGFLRQCMVHFPFGGELARDARVEEPLLLLNVSVCELVALIRQGAFEGSAAADPAAEAELGRFLERAVAFVLQTVGLPVGQRVATQQLSGSAHLQHGRFVELLPVIWRLARGAGQDDADRLLTAVLHYARVCPPTSTSKALCIRFLSQIIQDQWSRAPVQGALCLAGPQLAGLVAGWVLGLPKLLWRLRDRNPDASMAAVEALRLVLRRRRLLDAAAADAVQAGLLTLFCVSIPGKGTVHGPFRQYPPALQRAVLEAVASCPQPSDKLRHAVRASLADAAPCPQVRAAADAIVGGPSSYRLVVIGGGAAGLAVSSTLSEQLGANEVAVIEPSAVHYQQPLFTFVGGGLKRFADAQRPMGDVIAPQAKWIAQAAAEIDPAQNTVTLADGTKVAYEYLVVAAGIELDFAGVKGLQAAIGRDGVASNYSPKYVQKTFEFLQSVRGGNALFTMPATPIKCAGAPQKIAYLADELFRNKGIRDRVSVSYYTALGKIFAIDKYASAMSAVAQSRDIGVNLFHDLVEVDGPAKKATFQILGSGPRAGESVTVPYEFLHVTPPMKPFDFIKRSPIANAAGFVEVDQRTLQHGRFPNIYAIGDCSSLPTSKTAAAAAAQASVLKHNLLRQIRGSDAPVAEYDGYTSCPLVTGKHKLVLAEFSGYTGAPHETFFFNQANEHAFSYWLTADVLPAIYWNSMLKGTWSGPASIRKVANPASSN
ncbi:hypothetical protein LPJ61_000793 [Coemansia biformis]|uniref:Sulfide:quinone oxidoreductase, mitochondrial n=1 Tax=Coemansia biformis TaxID=1286918 RepID=A0A9W8CXV7_9FUNG|nr:hypothetical protein LPJ61_000793 [Coemansia biformis]